MPRVSPIQEAFNAGEISGRIQGRVSTEAYKSGVDTAINWQPLVQGPIRIRDGSTYLGNVDSRNWTEDSLSQFGIRTVTFQRGIDRDVIIEIGEDQLILLDSITGVQIDDNISDQLIKDNQWINGANGKWSFEAVVWTYGVGVPAESPFLLNTVYNQGTPDAYVSMYAQTEIGALGGFAGGAYSPKRVTIDAGSIAETATFTLKWQLNVHPSVIGQLGGYPLADLVVRVQVTTVGGSAGDIHDEDITISSNKVWQETEITFVPGVTQFDIRFGLDWNGGDLPTDELLGLNIGVSTLTIPLGSGNDPVEFDSPWTEEQLECLQVAMDSGEQEMTFTHQKVESYRLRYASGQWTFEEFSAITTPSSWVAPTSGWAPGKYPGACAYHEGRLYLGGSIDDPATIWGSESGDYRNFDASAPADKADPLLFPLSAAGTIKTLTSRKALVINTDIAEIIGTSESGVIAYDDFSFPKQTDWGSGCVSTIAIGREMLYTSASQLIVRNFKDKGDTNYGWDGNEISLLAQSIFGSPVRQMVFVDEPSYQAVFLLADGTLGMATYYYPEEVIGWWRFRTAYNDSPDQDTNKVVSIAKFDTSSGAALWLTINRTGFDNTGYPSHEVISFDSQTKARLDSCLLCSVDPTTGICSGLDHLDGQTVNVVVYRAETNSYTIHTDVAISGGDSEPLDDWAWGLSAYMGLSFENTLRLLPVEGVSNRGTAQTSKRRYSKVYLRLNDSAVPLVEGQYPRDRFPSTPMGDGESFISDDIDVTDLGTDRGVITITQDLPLSTEITGIFGKVRSSET